MGRQQEQVGLMGECEEGLPCAARSVNTCCLSSAPASPALTSIPSAFPPLYRMLTWCCGWWASFDPTESLADPHCPPRPSLLLPPLYRMLTWCCGWASASSSQRPSSTSGRHAGREQRLHMMPTWSMYCLPDRCAACRRVRSLLAACRRLDQVKQVDRTGGAPGRG